MVFLSMKVMFFCVGEDSGVKTRGQLPMQKIQISVWKNFPKGGPKGDQADNPRDLLWANFSDNP